MRSAKNWFEEELSGEPLTQESVIECIRMVQEDAIRETVKECKILSELKFNAGESGYLDKESVEILADKLIKEL